MDEFFPKSKLPPLSSASPSSDFDSSKKYSEKTYSQKTYSKEELARAFNTSVVATQVEPLRDFASELHRHMETPAYQAILFAVEWLAQNQSLTEKEAAETLIKMFRKVDSVWRDYVFHEGVDRLKG